MPVTYKPICYITKILSFKETRKHYPTNILIYRKITKHNSNFLRLCILANICERP